MSKTKWPLEYLFALVKKKVYKLIFYIFDEEKLLIRIEAFMQKL
jgi:hypothetical protein